LLTLHFLHVPLFHHLCLHRHSQPR
jgi:hypothetical protein